MKNWKDITLGQFLELNKALTIEDETEKMLEIASIVFGDEVADLNLREFSKRLEELQFLKEEIPISNKVIKTYTIKGREYELQGYLGNITTSQYIDFNNYSKDNSYNKMLAVFFVPKGHKYNDGYDMLQVFDDMLELPITVAQSTAFFFGRQFSTFIRIFQRYSTHQIQKTDLPKEVKKNLKKIVENSADLALSPLFSSSVK